MDENIDTSTNANGSKMMPIIVGLGVLLLIGGGAFYLLSNKDNIQMNTTVNSTVNESMNTTSESGNTTDGGDSATDEMTASINTIEVTGSSFKFDPTEIMVKKGDTVRIVFTNSDGMHDFVIDEFDARTKVLKDGESETIEFVADQAGKFEYYCSVGQHRQMGMVGNLIVAE